MVKYDGIKKKTFHANNSLLIPFELLFDNLLARHRKKSLFNILRKISNKIRAQKWFDGIKWKTIKCILFYDFSLRLPIIFSSSRRMNVKPKEKTCYTNVEMLLLIGVVRFPSKSQTLSKFSSSANPSIAKELMKKPIFISPSFSNENSRAKRKSTFNVEGRKNNTKFYGCCGKFTRLNIL